MTDPTEAMLKNTARAIDLVQQAMHAPPRSNPMPAPTANGRADAQERLDNLSDSELLDHCEGEWSELEARWWAIPKQREEFSRKFEECSPLEWEAMARGKRREIEGWAAAQLRSRIGANLALGVVPDFLMGE